MFFALSAQRTMTMAVVGALTLLLPELGEGSTMIDFNFFMTGSDFPAANSGPALAGSAGDFWNSLGGRWDFPLGQSFSNLSLRDTNNNATSVQMDLSIDTFFGKGGNSPAWAFDGTPFAPLMDQYAYSRVGGTPMSLTLKNLAPGAYDLYIYSSGSPDAVPRVSQFTATASNGSAVASAGPEGGVNTFQEGVNYVHFQPIVGLDGQISISGLGIGNETSQPPEADINGFQLIAVPEPTSAGVLLLCSCGLLGRRRSLAVKFQP